MHPLRTLLKRLIYGNRPVQTGILASFDVHPTAKFNRERLNPVSGCALSIGEGSMVEGPIIFERPNAEIVVGKRSFVKGSLIASTKIEIGDDVLVAWNVTIVDHDSHSISFSKRARDVHDWMAGSKDWTHVNSRPVYICNKSWIGFNSIVLKGVRIGEGAVVGAGSVVTKEVDPWTVVVGNPARCIKEIPEHER
jgi:acetyltransferase-like isoleucine patch superfamily enzyme